MTMNDVPGGVAVRDVAMGLAADAGLQAGDIVLRVDGVPVYAITDVWVLMRERKAGEQVTVEYVRGGERRTGQGTLTGWPS
jgi:putative serine protease PepD